MGTSVHGESLAHPSRVSSVSTSATERDPARYLTTVDERSGVFSGSVLLGYKINWQSVLFVGCGDDRELSDTHRLTPSGRQVFTKLSYAFQR